MMPLILRVVNTVCENDALMSYTYIPITRISVIGIRDKVTFLCTNVCQIIFRHHLSILDIHHIWTRNLPLCEDYNCIQI